MKEKFVECSLGDLSLSQKKKVARKLARLTKGEFWEYRSFRDLFVGIKNFESVAEILPKVKRKRYLTRYSVHFYLYPARRPDRYLRQSEIREDLKELKELLFSLQKLKEIIKNGFSVQLEKENKEVKIDYEVAVLVSPYDEVGEETVHELIIYFPVVKDRAQIRFNYPSMESDCLPPEKYLPKSGDEIRIESPDEARNACIELIESIEKFARARIAGLKERLKFLKQPVENYTHLTRPVSVKNGITRDEMFQRFYDDVKDVFRTIADVIEYQRQEFWEGEEFWEEKDRCFVKIELPGEDDCRYDAKIVRMIECIRRLKRLVSCLDYSFVEFKLRTMDREFGVVNYGKCWVVPGSYTEICKENGSQIKKFKDFPFIDKIKYEGDGKELLRYLFELEKFFERKIQQKNAKDCVSKVQSNKRRMML